MSPARAEWLRSPHLARAEGGPEALATFRRLPEAEQREVVRFGDVLAETSLALAQAYALRAPRARARMDRDRFALWGKLVVDIASGALANREAAVAFLRLDPVAIASCPRPLLERWLDLAGSVQALSRKLAALFLEGSGAVLPGLRENARARLEQWAEAGMRLASGSGWRGEFLAAAFYSSGAAVLPVLSGEEIRRWTALGAAVQIGRELGQGFFQRLPEGVAALSAAERAIVFDLCAAAVPRAPRAAASLFAGLPPELARIDSSERLPLLRALASAAVDAEAVLGLVPLLDAIVRSIPEGARRAVLERVAESGAGLPLCVVPLLRSLPRALEHVGAHRLPRWIERGEAIAEANPDAGRAYFALESRTALRFLHENSAAVHLEEIQAVLRSYARMLSGQSLTLRGGDGVSMRAFLDRESLECTSLALPDNVDFFDSWEDNFAILKLATAGGVGRLLYGTYQLSLARVCARLPPPLASVLAALVKGDALADLLEAVPDADPLIPLFAACEGARIDFRLRRSYRGHAAELARIGARLARRVPRARRSAELVLFLIGAGVSPVELSTEELPAELVGAVTDALRSPEATVDDALAVAIQIRERLADSIAISGFGPATSYEELLFEKVTGNAVLDPEPDGGDEPGRQLRPTDVLDLEPKAVEESEEEGPGTPLSADELKRLLEAGVVLKVGRSAEAVESAGIFARDLRLLSRGRDEGEDDEPVNDGARRGRRVVGDSAGFDYDEWDYQIRDYRNRWCHLDEVHLGGDAGEFFQDTLSRYADLLPEVRRQFQRLRPERYLKVRGLEDGEDFDLNAVVEARVEVRARRSPSPRLYVARRAEERDVATLFLLDMSASTDEPLQPKSAESADRSPAARGPQGRERRIIDVTKEALVIMAEALEELGDRYAIYGFSGQGRDNVEFYLVKQFQEGLTGRVRGRIGAIEPRRSTRMGTALRHARAKMANLASRSKHIFLLSDGFPQDFDYGSDRRSNTYGIQDTMIALQECQAAGITPFCITVDKTGHDYLRQMCETSRYLVIDDVASLPTELPKIYERWVRA
jgi:nitric oxide reductase NorD protein